MNFGKDLKAEVHINYNIKKYKTIQEYMKNTY